MENKVTKTRQIIKDGEDITAEVNEEQAAGTDPVPSSSVTSTGLIMKAPIHAGTVVPTVFFGDNNTLNVSQPSSSNPHPDKRIEFNIQDCVYTFTGRERFIETLHEKVWNSQLNEKSLLRSKFIVICGMAGVGKTQVARKYIQMYKKLYHHVIWINAEKQSVAIGCFLKLAAEISKDFNHDRKQTAEENIVNEVYDFICKKHALVVFDNAGYYSTEEGKDNLQSLLPRTVKTEWTVPSIIVTTRNRYWIDFMVQELEGFELSVSLSFLSELKFENTTENQKLLKEIAELYQGLPLVLQQVLHYVRKKRKRLNALEESYTLSDFLSEISLNRKKIMSTNPADLAHPDVYTLFDLTFKDVATTNDGKNALQCLDIMVIFDPDFISTRLLKCIFRNYKKELANGLKLLHDYNLVTQAKNHYQMHRVVQAARIDSNKAKLLLDGNSEKCETSLQNVTLCCKGKQVELTFKEILNSICDLIDATAINSENIYELLNNIVQLHDQAHEKKSKQFMEFQNILYYKLFAAGNYRIAEEVIKTLI